MNKASVTLTFTKEEIESYDPFREMYRDILDTLEKEITNDSN